MRNFVYLILVSSIAGVVMSSLPPLAFVGGIVWGISLLLGGCLTSRKNLILIFGFNILLLYGLAGSSNLFFLLIFGIPSFIMGLLLGEQKGYYELQKWGLLTAVLLASLVFGLSYNLGEDAAADIQAEVDQYIQEIYSSPDLMQFYEQQGIKAEDIEYSSALVIRWIIVHQAAFYCIYAILAAYLVLLLSSYICRRNKLATLSRKPFREEKMPWQLTWVVIIALSLWLLGRDYMTNLYYIGSNMLVVAAPVTVYYGLAGLAFLWSRSTPGRRRLNLVFLIIFFLIIPLAAIIFVGLLGLFDSLLDYRKLDHKKEVKQ